MDYADFMRSFRAFVVDHNVRLHPPTINGVAWPNLPMRLTLCIYRLVPRLPGVHALNSNVLAIATKKGTEFPWRRAIVRCSSRSISASLVAGSIYLLLRASALLFLPSSLETMWIDQADCPVPDKTGKVPGRSFAHRVSPHPPPQFRIVVTIAR